MFITPPSLPSRYLYNYVCTSVTYTDFQKGKGSVEKRALLIWRRKRAGAQEFRIRDCVLYLHSDDCTESDFLHINLVIVEPVAENQVLVTCLLLKDIFEFWLKGHFWYEEEKGQGFKHPLLCIYIYIYIYIYIHSISIYILYVVRSIIYKTR